jgi:hypothetical protein
MVAITASNMTRLSASGKAHPLQSSDRKFIWENCGDHCLTLKGKKRKGHFVDPLLKLYHNAPLMLVANEDVSNGHANGSRVLLKAVIIKPTVPVERSTQTIKLDGLECPLLHASDVEHLVCVSERNNNDIFCIQPKQMTCKVNSPIPNNLGGNIGTKIQFTMKLEQIPVLVNNCTTGHKLQGQDKENLIISVWSARKNWNYVALSRVKTRAGLYLAKKLPYDADFSTCNELRQMLELLRQQAPEEVHWDINEEREVIERRRRDADNNN